MSAALFCYNMGMNIKSVFAAALGVALVVSGCSRQPEEPAFAVIDGWPLTVSYVKDLVLVQARIAELTGHPVPPKEFNDRADALAMRIVPSLISTRLLRTEYDRKGVQPTQEDVAAVLAGYEKTLHRTLTNVNDLVLLFGPQAETMRSQFDFEAKAKAYEREFLSVTVTDADLTRFYRDVTNRLNAAAKINSAARKKGDAAWGKLQAGEPWEIVAKAFTEDAFNGPDAENYWKIWGSFRLQDMYLPQVAMALPNMKKGEYSRPLDTDDGLLIVKVLAVDKDTYTCARILLRMAYPVPVPSREEAERHLHDFRQEGRKMDLMSDLRNQATITYPMGTNFTYRIWGAAKGQSK